MSLVRVMASGAISTYDLLRHSVNVATDDQVPAQYRLCFEILPEAVLSEITWHDIKMLVQVENMSAKNVGAMGAFVASAQSVYRQVRALLAAYRPTRSQVRLFPERAAALDWLTVGQASTQRVNFA